MFSVGVYNSLMGLGFFLWLFLLNINLKKNSSSGERSDRPGGGAGRKDKGPRDVP